MIDDGIGGHFQPADNHFPGKDVSSRTQPDIHGPFLLGQLVGRLFHRIFAEPNDGRAWRRSHPFTHGMVGRIQECFHLFLGFFLTESSLQGTGEKDFPAAEDHVAFPDGHDIFTELPGLFFQILDVPLQVVTGFFGFLGLPLGCF